MIDRLIELVLGNVFEVLIILFIGLIMSELFSYLYWKGQVRIRDSTIRDLDATIQEKDIDIEKLHLAQEILKKQYTEIESLNRQIEENKRGRIRLSQQINEKVVDLEKDFKAQLNKKEQNIQALNSQVDEKDASIDSLKNRVANLEEVNQKAINLSEQLETDLSYLKTQLEDRDQNIQALKDLVNEKDASIDLLKNRVANLEEVNQKAVNLTEQLETDRAKLEKSVEEKTNEISSIIARVSVMQDDLTHIVGIGPKVASILRGAGVNTFTKLGSIEFSKLREVLEAANPSLLRLTDPSTWSEQAKLASEKDWESLSALQESLKGSRRNKQ